MFVHGALAEIECPPYNAVNRRFKQPHGKVPYFVTYRHHKTTKLKTRETVNREAATVNIKEQPPEMLFLTPSPSKTGHPSHYRSADEH